MTVALLALLLSAAPDRVIPPGQEAVLSVALGKGRALPNGCTWAGASIQATFIESKYACADSPELTLRFELLARGEGTRQFSGPDGPLAADVLAALDAAPLTWTPTNITDARRSVGLAVPRFAWLVLLGALAILVARRLRTLTREGLEDASLVFVAAFVLRAVVPWGPLDFAEPERLSGLWLPQQEALSAWSSFSVLFEPARLLGVALSAYRWLGPVLGAATCVLVVATAKRLGVSRAGAVIAGLALATWPVHVRFSASGNAALLAALLWLAVLFFTLEEKERTPTLELVLLSALVLLCVHARAEGRFIVLPVAVWWWTSSLAMRTRLVFAALTSLALIPYALENLVPSGSEVRLSNGVASLLETLLARGVTPDWSLLAGLVGLALPGLRRAQRAQLALVFLAMIGSVCAFGSEDNPLWGHWRYLIPTLPFVALGVGRAVDAVARTRPRAAVVTGLVFALLPLVMLRGVLLRRVDLQEEFQFVLRTAGALPRDAVVLLDAPEEAQLHGFIHFELTPAMAATLAGRSVEYVGSTSSHPRVLFQGLTRRLDARRTLKPQEQGDVLLSERMRVVPFARVLNSQCPATPTAERPRAPPVLGWSLDECEVELSWVRVR